MSISTILAEILVMRAKYALDRGVKFFHPKTGRLMTDPAEIARVNLKAELSRRKR